MYARQDYCGLLSEEAVRKNGVLLYELLDEVVDYGFPQNSSSEALREFVLNEPTVLHTVRLAGAGSPPAALHTWASSGAPRGAWAGGCEEPGIARCARGARRWRLRAGPWPRLRDSCKLL